MRHDRTVAGSGIRPRTTGLGALLALGLLGFATVPAEAQNARTDEDVTVVLRGVVVDAETGQPVHGAFVSQGGNDGYLTHEDGSFALPVWPYGEYTLFVELLGYETLTVDVPGPEPEPFVLRVSADPIQLEGLTVLVDRFEQRRRRVSVAVRAFDREDLLRAASSDVVDWVKGQYGLITGFCAATRGSATLASLRSGAFMDHGQECVLRRGGLVQPAVYIDEIRAAGGLEELRTYRPQDLYTIEVYDRGTAIYAYTPHFVDRVLKGRRFLTPVLLIN